MEKGQIVTLRSGKQAEVVFESQFRKYLVVVLDNETDLPSHFWLNENGRYYADKESENDVVI